jgi:hypothetical protein
MSSLRPHVLTWTALLGKWVEFARASVALPRDAEGDAWRGSVAAIINLQAVTFALGEVAELAADERALALDKAAILIDRSTADLKARWVMQGLPEMVEELIADASGALAKAGQLHLGGE